MKKTFLQLAGAALFLFSLSACKKDKTEDPAPTNEGEVITTMKLLITDGMGMTDTVTFYDPDGAGGASATADSIILDNTNFYVMEVLLLNETATPVDTISNEVEDEGVQHKFVYTSTPASGFMTTSLYDQDLNGNDLGLTCNLATGSAGKGTFHVQLRHYNTEADKTNGTNNYSTDIDVTFGVRLQ